MFLCRGCKRYNLVNSGTHKFMSVAWGPLELVINLNLNIVTVDRFDSDGDRGSEDDGGLETCVYCQISLPANSYNPK